MSNAIRLQSANVQPEFGPLRHDYFPNQRVHLAVSQAFDKIDRSESSDEREVWRERFLHSIYVRSFTGDEQDEEIKGLFSPSKGE